MFVDGKQKWNRLVIKIEKECKLKDFLIDELNFSIRSISKLKREKNIFLNGEICKPTCTVKNRDIIEIVINEEKSDFEPQNLNVNCLYDDFDLLVMDKPPYMVVHPTKSHFDNTLANAVAYYIENNEEHCKIRFVNRLDMNTSGIVIVAKNAYAHHKLSIDMSNNSVDKYYIAVVEGNIEKDRGTIDLPIYRETEDSIKRCIDNRGQRSITHFEVLERFENHTLVKLKLETGRTHQIRVHLTTISKGIVGDELYGVMNKNLINRQALHAYSIKFYQPRMNNEIEIKSDIPEDIQELIIKLRKNNSEI